MTTAKGTISIEHTVWCCAARRLGIEGMPFQAKSTIGHPDGCESYYQASLDRRRIARVASNAGWIRTREFGWLCPPCAAAYREWKEAKT